ncbi:AIPR family protein [Flectobacillus roseus]|uniref:AIPR family protein n=1 Tax=Flectobacillus roseus TaxID=502259 RepID=A0ABT6Y376_9BACT|nr:AIPR family protein [Flectobacillus roseus]MDI9858010.1 AIPR family protein [Flectobacillus roseus]
MQNLIFLYIILALKNFKTVICKSTKEFIQNNFITPMSKLIVNRIKNYLEKTFKGKIDLSDLPTSTKDEEKQNFFLTRALAAYALTIEAVADIDTATSSITDGFDDNGIDAIYYNRSAKILWLVQSKYIHSGVGGIDNGDVEKFTKGVKRLIDADLKKFNSKVNNKKDEILEALDDSTVKIQIIFAYTGKKLSTHNLDSITELLDEQNETEELLMFTDFNIDKVYKGLETGGGIAPINEDITILNWGHIEQPFKSYYGQIAGTDLGNLWDKYGRRLFTENIRNFLGVSTVNDEIIKTIKTEPDNFIYFNNGITILCESIKKKPLGGADKLVGAFKCNGISVVNGAQTLGSIGSLHTSNPNELSKVKVMVKFISLEDSPEGFGQRITIATNTQNKVEKKDFVSLDTEQARLKIELKLENIEYHYKRTNERIIVDENNYLLEEVGFSLASLFNNVDYSTMVKKESGRLWEDVSKQPYTDLFNQNTSAHKIIKAVRIYRYISKKMDEMASKVEGRERSIYRYGNSFITHIICQKINKGIWADSFPNFEDFFNKDLPNIADDYIIQLKKAIETEYPESMIVYVLRNYGKCRHLKTLMR